MFTRSRAGVMTVTIGAAMVIAAAPPLVPTRVAAQTSVSAETDVARIGAYVARYYERAQSVMADEAVAVQPLGRDLSADGFARRLLYELRVEWNPDAVGDESPATITRRLVAVNGRPPDPKDEPKCLDPKNASPEPLGFLLPDRREKFTFKSAGVSRIDGRPALMVDYRSVKPEPPTMTIEKHKTDECITFDLPGRTRGRVWADPETGEILRLDEQLTGMVDVPLPRKQQRMDLPVYYTIERFHSSMLYRRVTFHDPEETIVLPSRVDTLSVINGGGVRRMRITETFSNYRRFITGTRVIQ
jgi:hypothetical protein